MGAITLAGLDIGFGAALGFGWTGTVTVLVVVCVLDDPGEEDEDTTQTVTDPEPIFEPWLSPELEDPEPQAIAREESKETKAAAISRLAKPNLAC